MAGIGFRLQAILKKNSYRSLVQAYFYSALISTGPWMLAIVGLTIIGVVSRLLMAAEDVSLFRAVVAYTYAGSLILTGTIHMGTTRYVADRLFVNDTEALRPCFNFVGLLTVIAGGALAGAFYLGAGLDAGTAAAGVVFFQAVSLTWIGMIYLSAAKDYMAIVRAFSLGYLVSVAAALAGAHWAGLRGMLWGFAGGQVALAALLGVRVRVEFPSNRNQDSLVTRHWRRMPLLIVIGIFYNLGIWVDKFVFWFGPRGERLHGWFYMAPRYDTSIFLGYVTIVPAMALFLIRIETGFYKRYAAFYSTITQGGDYDSIEKQKENMIEALRLSASRLLKLQGLISFSCILLAPALLEWLGMPPDLAPTLRLGILAAFTQVMLLILLIILLYFDWQMEVAVLSVLFTLLNAGLTFGTTFLDERFHGLGYLGACLITLAIGLARLERRMRDLEWETFARQPMRA